MSIPDLDHDSSDSEYDDALFADINAISKACRHTAPGCASAEITTGDTVQTSKFDSLPGDSSESDEDFQLFRETQHKYGGGDATDPVPQPNSEAGVNNISRTYNHYAPGGASAETTAEATVQTSKCDSFPIDSSESDEDFQLLRETQQKYGASDPVSQPNFEMILEPADDDDLEFVRAIERRFSQYSATGTNCIGVGESQGMLSSDDGLTLSYNGMLNAEVGDRLDGNEECLTTSLTGKQPEVALAFIDAIRKNRLAQRHIRSQMISIEARMEKVDEMIKRVKIVRDFDVQGRRKIAQRRQDDRVQLISVPNKDRKLVASAMKHGPQENARVVNYRIAFKKYPQWIHKERWTKEERMNLQKGIIQQLQKRLLLKSMDRLIESEGPECSNGVDEVMSKIGDVQVDPQTIKLFLPYVDWDELAYGYLPRRSGQECQARWINFEDPLINRGEWTRLEDISLLNYLQNKGYDWPAVAESLRTNRTAYQCLIRYQRSLNPSLIKRVFTPAEDAELMTAVQTYGESNWSVVASALEGRTGSQCLNRWMKTLCPSKQKKGRWSPDEDKRLKIAVMIIGRKSWNKIAEFVPGRTQSSCRDRWMNNLDPSLNLGKWTKEEDARLEEAVRVHNYCWAKIATCVPPRTDSQCRRRWKSLFPDEAVQVQAQKNLIRYALPGNFVDREPNRPTLGANDFVPLALENTQVVQADSSTKGKKKQNRRTKPYKVSDAAFSNFPKKSRSGRCRSRRVDIYWEVPVSSKIDDTLPNKRRRTGGSRIKQNDHAEANSTLAASKKSVKGARRNRKGGENETTSQCKHAEVEVQGEHRVIKDLDGDSTVAVSKKSVKGARKKVLGEENEIRSQCKHAEVEVQRENAGSVCKSGSSVLLEEHQQELVASVSELGTCATDNFKQHDGDATGNQCKRRRLNHVLPEDWENAPLASVFEISAKLRTRKV